MACACSSESCSGKKIPWGKPRAGSIPAPGTKSPSAPAPFRFPETSRCAIDTYGLSQRRTLKCHQCGTQRSCGSGLLRCLCLAHQREGVHPETPRVPFTPGWDLVGTVDQLGEGASDFELGERVAAGARWTGRA